MKKLALTMGDPAGVGPELCIKAAHELKSHDTSLIIYGNIAILQKVAAQLGLSLGGLQIKDHPVENADKIVPGKIQKSCGAAAYMFLVSAIEDAKDQLVDAVVTCPINKAALEAAGVHYPGHTEILVEETEASSHAMMLTGSELSCSLVTTHIGICDVPAQLTTERIIEVAQLSADVMQRRHQRAANIAVLGLNPHAGEGGLFGNKEEELIIQPAIDTLKEQGINVIGPLPPDTAFLPRLRQEIDAYVCMYHDQGLIPLKTLCFDEGVNVTLGLPIVRTSVDHGTAFDIAWQGIASTESLRAAIKLAEEISAPR